MNGHVIEVCQFGQIHQRCRCPGPHRQVQVSCDQVEAHGPSGESVNAWLAGREKKRDAAGAKGLLLRFDRSGVIGVPFRRSGDGGGWDVVIVSSLDGRYPRGGWDVFVGDREIEVAEEMALGVGGVVANAK